MKKRDIIFIFTFLLSELILSQDITILFISNRASAAIIGAMILFMVINYPTTRNNSYIFLGIFFGLVSFSKLYYNFVFNNKLLVLPLEKITDIINFEIYLLSFAFLLFIFLRTTHIINKKSIIHLLSNIFISIFILIFNNQIVPIFLILITTIQTIIKRKKLEKIEFVYVITSLIFSFISTVFLILHYNYNINLYAFIFYYSKLSFYYFVVRLITENKNTLINKEVNKEKESLLNINKEKSKILTLITHDIKNMLQGIIGLCQITKTFEGTENQKEIIDNIYQISLSMNLMLTDFLIWSKTDLNFIEVKKTDFNINQLIDKVTEEQKFNADLKNIKIKHDSSKQINVYADINMIEIILRNIINNAIKFARINTEIEISTEIKNDNILINIKDNGIRISEEAISEILNNKLIKTDIKSGFGLKIVKEFLEKNNGSLFIKSNNEETTVSFNLPLSKEKY